MVVLLKDDTGFPHPVAVNVTPEQIPGIIEQAKAEQRRLCADYGLEKPVPIQAIRNGRMVTL